MATLPPRKNQTPTRLAKQQLTPLQTLLQMGFAKHRAEKALAATGNRSIQSAADWLLAHINDPYLDENEPREYVLYACPSGPFLEQLEAFWIESRELCGWNGAHNCLPHITLVSFFKAPDECEPELSRTLKRIVDHANAYLKRPLDVELFTNNTFMGLFVTENDANFLKRLALNYVKEVSPSIISDTYEQLDALVACFPWCGGVTSNTRCIPRSSRSISLEPHVKSLHLTLAYKFEEEHTETLKQLVERLNLTFATTWELRLYSRDPRVTSKRVYRVTQSYRSREADELELHRDDFICVTDEAIECSKDGWVEGLSTSTGCSGLFPLNYTVRVPESDTWTLHRSVQICNATDDSLRVSTNGDGSSRHSPSVDLKPHDWTPRPTPSPSVDLTPNRLREVAEQKTTQELSRRLNWDPSTGTMADEMSAVNQKLYIMRHGERVDFTFTKWTSFCFDSTSGAYRRLDLNMPQTLPIRSCPTDAWRNDSPITNVGHLQAKLTGEMLKENGIDFEFVYSSPSFRCVQTTQALLQGMGVAETKSIRIEPALFEWCGWYPERVPEFIDTNELAAVGYNIDRDYVPLVSVAELSQRFKNESLQEFYERNHLVTDHSTKLTSKNILLVAHAANIETNSRLLVGGGVRTMGEIAKLMSKVSYASLLALEKVNGERWQIVASNVHPISHNKNFQFDWRNFVDANVSASTDSCVQQSAV